MADTTRLTPGGVYLTNSLLVATPVGSIIEANGALWISLNASVASYAQLTPAGTSGLMLVPDNVFRIGDSGDTTKRIAFDAAGITTATTRTWTAPDVDINFGLTPGNIEITDPGTGAAIPVTRSGSIELTIGAGAETNTLANPTAVGQELAIVASTVGGGTRAITAAARINQATNTVMTFNAVGDFILLRGIKVAGALRWQVVANESVALS